MQFILKMHFWSGTSVVQHDQLLVGLVPVKLPVIGAVGGVYGVTVRTYIIIGRILRKFRRQRSPVQMWFPIWLSENFQYLLHHNIAPHRRKMYPIRKASIQPIILFLNCIPKINNLHLQLPAHLNKSFRIHLPRLV